MKEEYGILLINMFVWLGFNTILALVLDLFHDGAFGIFMVITLISVGIIFGLAFIIQAFKTNYKITKK